MGRRNAARILAELDGTSYDESYDGVATLTAPADSKITV